MKIKLVRKVPAYDEIEMETDWDNKEYVVTYRSPHGKKNTIGLIRTNHLSHARRFLENQHKTYSNLNPQDWEIREVYNEEE